MERVADRFEFDLLRFDEGDDGGDGGSGNEGDGNQGADDAGTSGGQQDGNGGSGGDGEGNKEPFAVFPDADSFNARMQRESRKQLEATAKEFGYNSVDEMKASVKAAKEREEQEKTELQRANEAKEQAEREREEAVNRANQQLVQNAAMQQAATLGIKPERINYALRLAELSDIEVTDGKVDSDAVKAALQKVVEDVPELKGGESGPVGGSGNPADGKESGGPKTSMNEYIRRAAGRG